MKVSSSKCSVKDCNKGSVKDCGFFVSDKPDVGMIFQLCQSHTVYFNALVQLIDGAISFAAFNGKWNVPIPPYSHYTQNEVTPEATVQEGTMTPVSEQETPQ
jgi:hypothetical protein